MADLIQEIKKELSSLTPEQLELVLLKCKDILGIKAVASETDSGGDGGSDTLKPQ